MLDEKEKSCDHPQPDDGKWKSKVAETYGIETRQLHCPFHRIEAATLLLHVCGQRQRCQWPVRMTCASSTLWVVSAYQLRQNRYSQTHGWERGVRPWQGQGTYKAGYESCSLETYGCDTGMIWRFEPKSTAGHKGFHSSVKKGLIPCTQLSNSSPNLADMPKDWKTVKDIIIPWFCALAIDPFLFFSSPASFTSLSCPNLLSKPKAPWAARKEMPVYVLKNERMQREINMPPKWQETKLLYKTYLFEVPVPGSIFQGVPSTSRLYKLLYTLPTLQKWCLSRKFGFWWPRKGTRQTKSTDLERKAMQKRHQHASNINIPLEEDVLKVEIKF